MMTTINKLEIPVIPTKVTSFINADIDFMTKEEGSVFYRPLEKIDKPSLEPLFAVKEGDGRFIYSFSKLFEAIQTEIDNIKDRRTNLIFYVIMGVFVWFGLIAYSANIGGSPELRLVAAGSLIFSLLNLFELTTTGFKKMIRSLEAKKTYVISESQDYIISLKDKMQKPVLII
jgi:hypothetical protein